MSSLLKGILIGTVSSIVGYEALKLLSKKETKGEAPHTVQSSTSGGTPVLIPWMSEYTEHQPYTTPISGGGATSGAESNVVQIKQPVRVREDAYKEIVTLDGTAADDYTSDNTYELSNTYQRFDILTEGGDVLVSLKTTSGRWTTDIPIPEGFSSYDFAITGIKVKNRTSGTNVAYYINLYRW